MANRHMKKCSTSLTVEKCKSKQHEVPFHTSQLLVVSHYEWPSLVCLQITNAREGVKKRESSYCAAEKVNRYNYYVKQYGGTSEKNIELPI